MSTNKYEAKDKVRKTTILHTLYYSNNARGQESVTNAIKTTGQNLVDKKIFTKFQSVTRKLVINLKGEKVPLQ